MLQNSNNNEIIGELESEDGKPPLCCSSRLILCFACFWALFNQTYVRVGISFVVVCMVTTPERNITSSKNCPLQGGTEISGNDLYEFDWSSQLRGHLISGAFYGFICGPFVSGYLSFKYGGKRVLIIGTAASGLLSALVPEGTRLHHQVFFVLRIFVGFFSGFIPPAFYDVMGHWAVPDERQILVGGALIGMPAACILNFPINGFWCSHYGWASTFYFSASWFLFSSLCFFFTIYDYPPQHPYITEKELFFIERFIPGRPPHLMIPWNNIVRSVPVYAYIITHLCANFGYLTIVLSLPAFMRDIHNLDLESNGFLSGIPFFGSLAGRIIMTFYFEKIRMLLGYSKTKMRKIHVFGGFTTVLICLFVITFLDCRSRSWVFVCFTISQFGMDVALTGGYMLSLLEVCPSYVNVVSGIANAFANVAGLISPLIMGLLTKGGRHEEWNLIFYITIVDLMVAIFVYTMFGTSELQSWDGQHARNFFFPRHSEVHL